MSPRDALRQALRSPPWRSALLVAGGLLLLGLAPLLDRPLLEFAGGLSRGFVRFADDLTNYADAFELLIKLFAFVLLLQLLTGLSYWRPYVGLAAALLGTGLLAIGLKFAVGRSRPRVFFVEGLAPGFDPFTFEHAWNSWPSGHAVTAAALSTCLALRWQRLSPLWLLLGVVLAATRVLIRAHWFSDVVAGLLIGHGSLRLALCSPRLAWLLASLKAPVPRGKSIFLRLRKRRAE